MKDSFLILYFIYICAFTYCTCSYIDFFSSFDVLLLLSFLFCLESHSYDLLCNYSFFFRKYKRLLNILCVVFDVLWRGFNSIHLTLKIFYSMIWPIFLFIFTLIFQPITAPKKSLTYLFFLLRFLLPTPKKI